MADPLPDKKKTLEKLEIDPKMWNFFSRHAHLLFCIAANPLIRVTDLANQLEITDRTIRSLLRTMESAGVIKSERIGRNNRYSIDYSSPLTHVLEKDFLYEPVVTDIIERQKEAKEALDNQESD